MFLLKRIAAVTVFALAAFAMPGAALAQSNVLFIFDASGSMKTAVEGGETRISLAKQAMAEALAEIPPEVRLGLILYGHRRAKDCGDLELVSPLGADDKATIAAIVEGVEARGETPIAESLRQAIRSFAALKGQPNRVVLVTDGVEECGGDPCAAAQAVVDAGLDLKVDVVGFTLTDDQRRTMQCVPELTGGSYYDAQNVTGLTTALAQVRREVVEAEPVMVAQAEPVAEEPESRINLISPENGGGILVAPNDVWPATADDSEEGVAWLRDGQEGVYGFRGGRPATFDTFTILVHGADNNPKEVEIFAGDNGPTGEFRSVATCTFLNTKLIRTPYQECKFPPVTARNVKAQILSSYGDSYVRATEWQVLGQLEASDALPVVVEAPADPAPATAINLISPENGGGILVAPNDVWLATADDSEEGVAWLRDGQEGVYGFQDERPATFDTFTILIAGADNNPKEVEIFASDDGPTGEFRSVATCTFLNTKLVRTPYQACKFPPVTARFVKAKILSSYGDSYVRATEWQILGQLEAIDSAAADNSAAASESAAISNAINLISPANGGGILVAPNDVWLATADDSEEGIAWLRDGQEGVYGFAGDKPATFDTFTILIAGADSNPKEVEIFVGDDGPTGEFRSIATCTFQNTRLVRTPYQACTFPPVTARFVKAQILSSYGDSYVRATEWQVLGQIEP